VRRDYKHAAFQNLFAFFDGERFPGKAYFAVTPDFVRKCNAVLRGDEFLGVRFKRFEDLHYFELEPVSEQEFTQLAKRIVNMHGVAYGWKPDISAAELRALVSGSWSSSSPERVRLAVRSLVDELDNRQSRN
jgi:hypothetical protein